MVTETPVLLWISLIALVPAATAGLLLRRGGIPRGWLLGVIVIAAVEGFLFWRINVSGEECLRSTCMEYSQAANCESGLSCIARDASTILLYQAAGIAGILLLAIAVLWIFLRRPAVKGPADSGTSI